MGFLSRLPTIIITATLTSAAWIVVGGGWAPQERKGGGGETASVAVDPSASRPLAGRFVPASGSYRIPVQGVAPAALVDTFDDLRGADEDEGHTHEALDILTAAGTPVLAAAGGVVEKLFTSRAGGLTIYTRSADGRFLLYYAHLQAYAPGLSEGQQVQAGQVLGEVGSTGNADAGASHLHFAILRTAPDAEWWEPARAINPYPLLTSE